MQSSGASDTRVLQSDLICRALMTLPRNGHIQLLLHMRRGWLVLSKWGRPGLASRFSLISHQDVRSCGAVFWLFMQLVLRQWSVLELWTLVRCDPGISPSVSMSSYIRHCHKARAAIKEIVHTLLCVVLVGKCLCSYLFSGL